MPGVTRRIREAVKGNASAVAQEVRETEDLMTLLMRVSEGEELTDAERARMRRQLLDVCKTIPALTVFVLPFGTLLVPILMEILPSALLPSAFENERRKRAKS
jgi:hypothetical protein